MSNKIMDNNTMITSLNTSIQNQTVIAEPTKKVGRPKLKNTVGGQFKFKDPSVIDRRFREFEAICLENKIPITPAGFAAELDIDRRTLMSYEYRDTFTDTIKSVKRRLEKYLEAGLLGSKNPIGYSRALSNGFDGWAMQDDSRGSATTILKIEFSRCNKKAGNGSIDVTPMTHKM
ncbi:MAG: hypothetical protein Q8L68_00850 [Methylococcales bacterium]|nr:hypothetical protein [Methylococcales bacterium]